MKGSGLWNSIDTWATRVIKWPVFVAATSIGVMMVLAVTDIIASKFFASPIPGTSEIIEEANVLVVCMAVAYVQLDRGHISVNVFENHFSKHINRFLRLFGYFVGIASCILVSWRAFILTHTMISTHAMKIGLVQFPLWPLPLVIFLGFALLAIAFVLVLIREIIAGS
ncbi:TRAP transporter small permease [Deltaproteobacteria bacterium]|nr:TRAP transporter small permease [Deltaproteobacteria bacterium]